jgi:L-malate glycosyltransferase
VPSTKLEVIAQNEWRQRARTKVISNGIATARYAVPPAPDAIPGFTRQPGDVVIGTIAGLRAVKDLPRLVRAFASAPANCRLVIVGTGPERDAILAAAQQSGVADRVHLPGFLPEPWRYVGLFDILALSSKSEQQPIAVMEGMAAGLPIVSTDVGDVSRMVSKANVHVGGEHVLREGLSKLALDPALRKSIGVANQQRAAARFDERHMIASYRELYWSAAR